MSKDPEMTEGTMKSEGPWRIAVIGFSHMHAGDQIRQVLNHPAAELVGMWDERRSQVETVAADFGLDHRLIFDDLDDLLERGRPEVAVICSTTAEHVDLVHRIAPHGVQIMLEKPFATSLEDADAMIKEAHAAGVALTVNWPLAWYPSHRTARRLILAGAIGAVTEVHYYDGNRGPLHHGHDKVAVAGAEDPAAMGATWWYARDSGGGSLLDYLGYGATLATWFRDGELPRSIQAATHVPPGLEVDEQSVVIARYDSGLSVLQTRWGTFSDPWVIQPYPRCGFVIVGSAGTILSEDYAPQVQLQTKAEPTPRAVPVDDFPDAERGGLSFLIDRLQTGAPIDGPSGWELSRKGQQIVDAAVLSVASGETVMIDPGEGDR
jgi:predicted dehydrogenase